MSRNTTKTIAFFGLILLIASGWCLGAIYPEWADYYGYLTVTFIVLAALFAGFIDFNFIAKSILIMALFVLVAKISTSMVDFDGLSVAALLFLYALSTWITSDLIDKHYNFKVCR